MKPKIIMLGIFFIGYIGFLYLESYTTILPTVQWALQRVLPLKLSMDDNTILYASNIYYKDSLDVYFAHQKKYKKADIEVLPGAMILLLIEDAHLDKKYISSIQAVLQDTEGKKKASAKFLPYKTEQYYAVLAVPHTLDFKKYRVVVKASFDEEMLKKERLTKKKVLLPQSVDFPIMVKERHTNEDVLYLNKKMAKTKQSEADPEVVKQAKEIWATTGNINPDSRYALGDYLFPLENYKYVTGMFSDRRVYVFPNNKRAPGRSHGGMDIAAYIGTPVYATATGKVVLAKERIVTGKSIVIEHFPGVFSMYYHLNSIGVEVNTIIMKGTEIGTVGTSGFSTGPHLHWEMRVNNIRVDPLLTVGELDNIKIIDILYK